MNCKFARYYSHQFKTVQRSWKLDLNRAVLLEKLPLEDYHAQINNGSKPFDGSKLSKERTSKLEKEIIRLSNLVGIESQHASFDSVQDLYDAIVEMEHLHCGYDRRAFKFFQQVGE